MHGQERIEIRSEGSMARVLRDHYESGDWWFFLPLDARGIAELVKIEQKFYAPGTVANDDFETMARLSRSGLFGVGLAHKRHLSRKRLAKHLRQRGVAIEAIQPEQVVLCLGGGTDPAPAMARLYQLLTAPIINPSLN